MTILFDKAEHLHLRDSSPVLRAPGEAPAIGQGFSDLLPTRLLASHCPLTPTALCTYAFYNTILCGNFYFLNDSFLHLLLHFGRKYDLQDDIRLHT